MITTDLTTLIGQVRYELGDDTANGGILPGGANFTDEAIEYELTVQSEDVARTAFVLIGRARQRWATAPQSIQADGATINYGSDILDRLGTVADALQGRLGGEDVTSSLDSGLFDLDSAFPQV